jgi:hypothetical protein
MPGMNHNDVVSSGIPILFLGGIVILALAAFVIHIVSLIQCATARFRDPNDKIVWILLILFQHILGTILWFAIGKSKTIPA